MHSGLGKYDEGLQEYQSFVCARMSYGSLRSSSKDGFISHRFMGVQRRPKCMPSRESTRKVFCMLGVE